MRVIHILKDGSRVDDITGRVVRMEDAETLYKMIHAINNKSHQPKNVNSILKSDTKKYKEAN
jgi:hypothetical protein